MERCELVCITSRSRVAGTPSDFIITFPQVVAAHALRVASAEIPMAQYTVHAYTSAVDFYDSAVGAVCTAVLTYGNYTGAQLATELAAQMTSACGVPGAYSVSYSSITQKLTIVRNGGGPTFSLRFGTGSYAAFSAARIMGYDPLVDTATAASSTSPYIVQLQGEDYVYLCLNGLGNISNTELVSNVVAKYVFPTGARTSSLDSLVSPLVKLGEVQNLRQVQVRLYCSDGRLYDLNGMDMSFTLELYCLDE